MMFKSAVLALALSGAVVGATPLAFADKSPIYKGLLSDLAVDGYDPVSYFQGHEPVKGAASFEYGYQGAKWRFSSAQNMAVFKADPAKYAPQFGGYCAWAVSQGYTAKGDPNTWKIVNGKLYLNYNADIQKKWEKDVPGLIAKGDANWPSVLKK